MMKKILIIAVLACLAYSQLVQDCPKDGRLVKCSTIEEPVCGVNKEGKKETFVNHCIACAIGKSKFTVEGKCENYPAEANFCSPKESKNTICTKIYQPHCGWFNQNVKCKAYPCAVNGGNRCEACSKQNVLYTTGDVCPKPKL